MCYKEELQRKNEEKLQRRFEEDNVPVFIRRYFIDIDSKAGAITYWIALKDLLLWMMENKVIDKSNISDISSEDFCEIEAQDIKRYLLSKQENGMKKTTLKTKKHIFSSFWNYLVNTNKCPVEKNIILNVKYKGKSAYNNLIRKLPSEEQLKKMEEKIMKKQDDLVRIRNIAVLRTLKGTGMREGELAGLDLDDLYFNEESYKSVGEMMPCIRIVGKGAYDKEDESRMVYVTGTAINAIKEWIEYRNTLDVPHDALFINKNKKRLDEDNIQKIFKSYGNGITPHMVRHWYATIMANKGKLVFTQQQFGHKSSDTTVNNYANGAYDMKDTLAAM